MGNNARRRKRTSPPLPATGRVGFNSLDPTENVLELVRTAIQRQDDLRDSETKHTTDIMELRANHYRDLRLAETARIDAIRAVDVGAVNRAAEVATTQASTLANQVAVSAEALRNQVSAAATAATIALASALEPIQKDIADLRKAQYEAQGQKTQIIDTRTEAGSQWQVVGVLIAAAAVIVTVLLVVLGGK